MAFEPYCWDILSYLFSRKNEHFATFISERERGSFKLLEKGEDS